METNNKHKEIINNSNTTNRKMTVEEFFKRECEREAIMEMLDRAAWYVMVSGGKIDPECVELLTKPLYYFRELMTTTDI